MAIVFSKITGGGIKIKEDANPPAYAIGATNIIMQPSLDDQSFTVYINNRTYVCKVGSITINLDGAAQDLVGKAAEAICDVLHQLIFILNVLTP